MNIPCDGWMLGYFLFLTLFYVRFSVWLTYINFLISVFHLPFHGIILFDVMLSEWVWEAWWYFQCAFSFLLMLSKLEWLSMKHFRHMVLFYVLNHNLDNIISTFYLTKNAFNVPHRSFCADFLYNYYFTIFSLYFG